MGALRLTCALIISISLLQISAAEIIIQEDLSDTYNVGDFVSINFSIDNPHSQSDFVESYLKCDGDKNLIDKRYIFLKDNNDIGLTFPLTSAGECYFLIEFLTDEVHGSRFKISDNLNIDYNLNNLFFFPGEKIEISGNISKVNGDIYSGMATFRIEDIVSKSFEVSNGEFYFDYIIEDTLSPKMHKMTITASEKNDNGEVINSGRISKQINIKPKVSSIEITAPDHITPPGSISFQVSLLNQVGQLIPNESIIVKILDSDNNALLKTSITSASNLTHEFSGTTKRGSLFLNAYYGNIFSSRPIYIEDHKEINTRIDGNNLIITNTGNTPFEGTFEFTLENKTSSETIYIELSLGIAEETNYHLDFSGTYNISSEEESLFSNVPLTGAAITVPGKIKSRSAILAMLLLLGLIGYSIFKFKKKTSPTKTTQHKNHQQTKQHFFIFVKTKQNIEKHQDMISHQGFKLIKLNNSLGLILYSKGISPAQDCLTLIKKIKQNNPESTILFNKYSSKNSIDTIKRFILANKKIIENTSENNLISDNIFKKSQFGAETNTKSQNALGFKMKFYTLDNSVFL